MLPGISGNYHERTRIVGIRNIFSCIGCVLPYFVSMYILGSEYSPVGSRGRFMVMGLSFGIFFALSILITFAFVKEEPVRRLPGAETALSAGEAGLRRRRNLYGEYASLFRSRSYRVYLVMMLSVNCMSGMIIGSYFYYTAYVGAHYRMYGLLFFFHGLTEIAGLPLVYLISRKFGKQLSFRFTMPVMLLGLAGTMCISPATARPWMLYLCALLVGFGVSGIGMVTSNLYSDLTDADELICGKRGHKRGRCRPLQKGYRFAAGKAVGRGVTVPPYPPPERGDGRRGCRITPAGAFPSPRASLSPSAPERRSGTGDRPPGDTPDWRPLSPADEAAWRPGH